MLSVVVIWAACLAYGWVHSWMASLAFKEHMRRRLGSAFFDRYYRLVFNIFSVVTLLPLLALTGVLPDRLLYRVPFPWVLITLAGQGAAIIVLLLGVLQTGAMEFAGLRQLFSPGPETSARLVTDGLYAWVRHPLYTAGLVFIWLSPVMSVNLLALFIGFSAYLVIGAHYEERKLRRIFGEAYHTYAQKTPMLIPIPCRFTSK
ncbi:MAG: isoprenylcysteine carboxylmethyltransferase family protein [Anaerolineales bacterium]|nr:isoprenylcysteine carboxylmethyltransferase family protein [Anaerolineales bacterium]